mmetsp:Transcript_45396/g.82980  ORF Transcript_45396/g.82980 Transcript_45396/m.82980 type:complete len:252 (+) Transcript_45396:1921-2676(+)
MSLLDLLSPIRGQSKACSLLSCGRSGTCCRVSKHGHLLTSSTVSIAQPARALKWKPRSSGHSAKLSTRSCGQATAKPKPASVMGAPFSNAVLSAGKVNAATAIHRASIPASAVAPLTVAADMLDAGLSTGLLGALSSASTIRFMRLVHASESIQRRSSADGQGNASGSVSVIPLSIIRPIQALKSSFLRPSAASETSAAGGSRGRVCGSSAGDWKKIIESIAALCSLPNSPAVVLRRSSSTSGRNFGGRAW